MLVCLPLFHNAGISAAILPSLLVGATCVVHSGSFNPDEVLSTVERYGVTVAHWVPTMLAKLMSHPDLKKYQCPSLKKIHYGSSTISDVVLDACLKFFKADFYQVYGQTETGMVLVLKPEDHTDKSRFTGRAMCMADVRVVDDAGRDVKSGGVGEIICKQRPLGMEGYYRLEKMTDETIRNGWIHTGDLVRVEENGYYTLVDRSKDMIISGGENIYCKELENVMSEYPGVEEVSVFGIPDDMWGEAVCAAIVPKNGQKLSQEEIIDFCASRLSSYKKPKVVEFRDELPKNASGKVMKKLLKDPYWAGRTKRV
ncbi:MAG: Long-chain-fatty-acid--CoA ligase [Syntrophorhabdus sp. PtaU1.Bin050]|nr:MAG: Long-chain-fatty-acid--CoA ligase [Syntrophorhabdus sp. PtaU1.Bin050]